MNRSKELKIGAVIAYFTIVINIGSGLLYTPWIISQIGDSDYGLYTLANSLINLFLFDFGLSAATSRFLSKYLAEGRQDKVDSVLGAIYKLYFLIDAILCVVLVVISVFLEQIYANLTTMEIQRFRGVFMISAVFAVINFPCVTFAGILNAYEKFISLKVADALYRIFTVLITVIALLCNGGLYALVCVQAIVGVLTLAYKFYIIKSETPIKIDFSYKKKGTFGELFGFSVWVTISTLSQRLIFGIMPSVLGIASSATAIAVFGIVSVIENYIHIITTALNGMFMPRISRIFCEQNYVEKLNYLLVNVGRFQFALHGIIVTGFVLMGRDFIHLWLDESYIDAYYGILLVTVPNLFYYSLQIANTAMMIQNHVKIQAITNMVVGIINIVLSFVFAKKYGVIGACTAIFVAYNIRNVGYFIAYRKFLKMDIKKLCKECYLPLGLCISITVVLGIGMNRMINDCNWMTFAIKTLVVIVFYFVLVLLIGVKHSERKQIKMVIKKRFLKKLIK